MAPSRPLARDRLDRRLEVAHAALTLGLAHAVRLADAEPVEEERAGLFEGQAGRLGVGEVDPDEGELCERKREVS